MKKSLCFLLILFTGFTAKSQVFIPQQYTGQAINQVIYNGTFTSSAGCQGQDYDFDLVYSQISPFATGVELSMQITSLSGTATLNGNAVAHGNTFAMIEPVTPFHFQFTTAGTINFSVRADGTPTTAGQTYPCYVAEKVSQFSCNNTYTLMEGEVFVPCTVATPTGISENENKAQLFFSTENKALIMETETEGQLIVIDMPGRIILNQHLNKGKHSIQLTGLSKGIYIARFEKESDFLKFVIQ